MSKKASKNLKKASEQLESAARQYKKAAKQEKKGNLAKAARHADTAQIKTHRAEYHASEAERQKAGALKEKHAEADGDDTI
jgi:hypothetical protein